MEIRKRILDYKEICILECSGIVFYGMMVFMGCYELYIFFLFLSVYIFFYFRDYSYKDCYVIWFFISYVYVFIFSLFSKW